MSIDVVDLRDFYVQRLGAVARHFVGRGVRRRWADTRGQRVLGIGYATPYLGLFREEAERTPRLHAGGPGRGEMADARSPRCRRWSTSSNCRCRMPRSIACCWCMRWRCRTIRPRCCAKSGGCWRRAGSCSRWCRTGAACGRAWTPRRSVTAGRIRARRSRSLLREAWFTPVDWSEALYVPPIQRGWFLRSAVAWERAGAVDLGAVRRRAYRRGDQAGLSRDSGQAREAPSGAGAAAGAGAVARRRGAAGAIKQQGRAMGPALRHSNRSQRYSRRRVGTVVAVEFLRPVRHVRPRTAGPAGPRCRRRRWRGKRSPPWLS